MAYHGNCFFAHEQIAGKGQRGKTWTAEVSSNILLSIVMQPQFLELIQQFQLSACMAVAVHQFLVNYAGNDVKIKWPNDLYWKDRKMGGILLENIVGSRQSAAANWQWAVAGIGININQTKFTEDLPNPVSLKQITGKTFDVIGLAKELCGSVGHYYDQLKNHGFEMILDQYNEFLYKKSEVVKLKKDNRIFEATIKSVTGTGKLVTQHAIEEIFDHGQVEWQL